MAVAGFAISGCSDVPVARPCRTRDAGRVQRDRSSAGRGRAGRGASRGPGGPPFRTTCSTTWSNWRKRRIRVCNSPRQTRRGARAGPDRQRRQAAAGRRERRGVASDFQPGTGGFPGESLTALTAGIVATWELDLFGRIAMARDAASLDAQSREALVRSTLLVVQSDVAQAYFALRASTPNVRLSDRPWQLTGTRLS